jgi:NitT/TauT family transport system substrate-binding protein
MKRNLFASALCLALLLSLLTGCGGSASSDAASDSPEPTDTETVSPEPSDTAALEGTEVNLAVLKGPTGVGAAKLLYDNENGDTINQYNVTVASDPANEIVPKLVNGELDIAAISTNLAASLYHKTEGGVQMLALNTLGVLYILENGDSVQSMADLAGRTIYATGQGSNPEYVLNYLLEQNGLTDVTVEWMASDELTTLMASGQADLCMLPVPAATAVQMKNADVRVALNLTEEWNNVTSDGVLTMGCIVVRTQFAQEHPEAVTAFLQEYADSIAFVTDDPDSAAPMVAQFEITANEQIALKAIPDCNLVCITGDEMRESIQGYFEVLFAADPTSIGGSIPDDAFYYIP